MSISTLLNFPVIYDFFQNLMGAKKARKRFVEQYVRPGKGDRILDIGCGTAQLLEYLPAVDYYGFDMNERYISRAKKQFGARGVFTCSDVRDFVSEESQKFDIVLACGVLHHLNDSDSRMLLTLAREALKHSGRFVGIDPCFVRGQSRIAQFLVNRDRGKFVRNRYAYESLVLPVFESVTARVLHDNSWIPYTHLVLECVK